MYSADECSLSKLKKLQGLSLANRIGFVVDAWAQQEIHTFKVEERRRIIQACCFFLKSRDKGEQIAALAQIDFKKILDHLDRLKRERCEK